MEKLISVAIVNWNGEKYLYKCIKSLLEQNYKNIEVIIIDNDSTDSSVKIIEDNFKNDVYYIKIKILDMLVELTKVLSCQRVTM